MTDINTCIFTGNLGKDAELRYTNGGQAVLNFSFANDQSWKNEQGEVQKRVNWINAVVFGKRAEAIKQWMLKGARIIIEGKLSVRQYQDKEDHNRTATEIVVDRDGQIQIVRFVDDERPQGNSNGPAPDKPQPARTPGHGPLPPQDKSASQKPLAGKKEEVFDDDLPF